MGRPYSYILESSVEETGDVLRNQELHYISKDHLSLQGNKTMRLMVDRLVDNECISRLSSRPSQG